MPEIVDNIVWKHQHLAPPIDQIPNKSQFYEALHGKKLRIEVDISHLPPDIGVQLHDLIKECWFVFDECGFFFPVKDFECCIDTGDHKPIAAKKIHYGPHETPIMNKCITQLLSLNQIMKFMMVLGSQRHSLLQNHIKTIPLTSTILFGASTSITLL